LYRIKLLRVERYPPSVGAWTHLAMLLEVDSVDERFADNASVEQIAPDGVRKALQHCLADERLLAGRRSGEERLFICVHQAVKRPSPNEKR
jgi:hypothetical protein